MAAVTALAGLLAAGVLDGQAQAVVTTLVALAGVFGVYATPNEPRPQPVNQYGNGWT